MTQKRFAAAKDLAVDGALLAGEVANTAVIAQMFDDSRILGFGAHPPSPAFRLER